MFQVDKIDVGENEAVLSTDMDIYAKKVVAGLNSGYVNVYKLYHDQETDVHSHEFVSQIEAHNGGVVAVDYAHPRYGDFIATAGVDGILNLFLDGQPICSVPTGSLLKCVSFWKGPENESPIWMQRLPMVVAAIDVDGSVWFIRQDDQCYLASSLKLSDFELNAMSWDHKRCELLIAGSTGEISLLQHKETEGWVQKVVGSHGDCADVIDLQVRPVLLDMLHGPQFATCGDDGAIFVWEKDDVDQSYSKNLIYQVEKTEKDRAIMGISFNETGLKLAVTLSSGKSLILIETNPSKFEWNLAPTNTNSM